MFLQLPSRVLLLFPSSYVGKFAITNGRNAHLIALSSISSVNSFRYQIAHGVQGRFHKPMMNMHPLITFSIGRLLYLHLYLSPSPSPLLLLFFLTSQPSAGGSSHMSLLVSSSHRGVFFLPLLGVSHWGYVNRL